MRTPRPLLPLAALLVAACAPEVTDIDPGPTPGQARIEVVGANAQSVEAGGELELTFRYVGADGEAVGGGLVDFAIDGEPAGASLSANGSAADEDGLATVIVRAADEARFGVTASAPEATPATVDVTVRPMAYGTLAVEVTYEGDRSVRRAELGLFLNARCDDLRTAVPSPHATEDGAIGGTSLFGELPLGVPMAVYALGIDALDQVAAEGCLDVTMTSEREDVHLGLRDVEVGVNGPFATVERFDVTDGFPSGLDTILEIAAGLSGSDPARWIVDRVAESASTPSWLRSALSSSFTRGLVADLLGDALDEIHPPSELAAIGRFGADVDAAFGGLTLDGQLDFPLPDEFGVATGTHRITQVRMPLSDGTEITRPTDVSAEVVVSFSDRIDVDEHALALPFGELVEAVLYQAGLSRLDGSPMTLGELVGSFFDCAALASYLGTGTYASLAESACNVGVSMLEARIDSAMSSLWDYDTLNLSGSADLLDADGDYDFERVAEGEAHARWTGPAGELAFDGTFEGSSIDDAPRTHRVRERLSGLE